ncbi:hypothetical protein ACTHPH_04710 [Paenibacillus pasadenensis]|uniref:Uncharacterized protein n=1 Tax=Paenibacillus pasadenensis TaxID=217090 RepID=A0A2N5N1R3_9BACL|nr:MULTISPECIES: hypothetical protein [Paenibacillus]PLT44272.1 hypothetical protein B8V81_2703 [Paenibacillus pasadenensis]QGG54795.1 hypothetical protein GE073_03765 [Paenibacillus sp. B01]
MAYNPFEDKSLHLTVPPSMPEELKDREPFNDVIRHGHIVTGFRISRSLRHLPAWLNRPLRLLIAAHVLVFLGSVLHESVALALELLPF